MTKAVIWTPEAEAAFDAIINYFKVEWSEQEVTQLINSTERVITLISEHPKMYRKTNRKHVHEALITPHNILIYKIYSTHIDLLTFWDTRKNPRKKKF
jgi:plasmid stabilization system protein ParE